MSGWLGQIVLGSVLAGDFLMTMSLTIVPVYISTKIKANAKQILKMIIIIIIIWNDVYECILIFDLTVNCYYVIIMLRVHHHILYSDYLIIIYKTLLGLNKKCKWKQFIHLWFIGHLKGLLDERSAFLSDLNKKWTA